MPIARFQMPDGRIARFEVPEGTTPEQAQSMIAESMAQQPEPAPAQAMPQAQPAPTAFSLSAPTRRQQIQSSMPMRVVQGMRDPIDAAAQLVPHTLGAVTSGFGMYPNKVSDYMLSEARRVDKLNAENEAAYQQSRLANAPKTISNLVTGGNEGPGYDAARLVGNIVSPANAAIASRLPATASTIPGLALYGAKTGAIGGALQPVNKPSSEADFWTQKAVQTGIGGLAGSLVTPIASTAARVANRLGASIASKIKHTLNIGPVNDVSANVETDKIIREALAESNQRIDDIPKVQYETLRQQVRDALNSGKRVDAAALMRKQDFESEGIDPLQSWITRDSQQYAKEMNLRGVGGVGEPLMARYDAANNALQKKFRNLSEGAQSQFGAGEKISSSLKSADEQMRSQVATAYSAARKSTGKDLDVPLHGLAQDYARIVGDYADNVPPAIRSKFSELGIDPSTPSNQRKVFTIEDADKLLKVINKNDPGYSNKPVSSALSEIRTAVKKAVTDVDASGGPYAPAVSMAAQRFKLHEAVPSLEASARGDVAPDDFVKRFILNGKVNDVKGMAKLLDSDSLKEAKAQIGSTLQRAAFGENVAGDKSFSAERYAKALRDIGDDKLRVFFNQPEIDSMKRAGRIGAYINSRPNVSAVNTSNTASAMVNMLGNQAQNVSRVAALANTLAAPIKNASAVNRALRAEVPAKLAAELSPEQIALLAKFLSGSGAASGSVAGSGFR